MNQYHNLDQFKQRLNSFGSLSPESGRNNHYKLGNRLGNKLGNRLGNTKEKILAEIKTNQKISGVQLSKILGVSDE